MSVGVADMATRSQADDTPPSSTAAIASGGRRQTVAAVGAGSIAAGAASALPALHRLLGGTSWGQGVRAGEPQRRVLPAPGLQRAWGA